MPGTKHRMMSRAVAKPERSFARVFPWHDSYHICTGVGMWVSWCLQHQIYAPVMPQVSSEVSHVVNFLAAIMQLYEWFSSSVSPSVRPSVCLSHLFTSHHRIIMKFSGVITIDCSDVHEKGQGQMSKVKVTKVKTQFSRFRTVTPVWIHIWRWNDAQTWCGIGMVPYCF